MNVGIYKRGAIASIVAVAAVLVAGTASAGYEVTGPEVARGVSPAGVPWKIRAQRERHAVTFEFYFDPPGYSDAGYFTQLPRPVPRRFVLTAIPGSDLSPFEEGDVSGVADIRVRTLVLRLSDDSTMTFTPTLAPKELRKRNPWVGGLRYFDQFFPPDVEPEALRALNRRGRLLDRLRFSD